MEMEQDSETDSQEQKPKVYKFSQSTLIFFAAILICSMAAGAMLILQFGTCSSEISVRTQVCGKENVIPIVAHLTQNASHLLHITVDSEPDFKAMNHTDNIRLPSTVRPIFYDLRIHPHILNNDSKFTGNVTIQINVTETCQNITLHANGLTIQESDVRLRRFTDENGHDVAGDTSVEIDRQYFVSQYEFFVIQPKKVLATGVYEIGIKFSGNMSDHLLGMFKSVYAVNNTAR